MHSLDDQRYQVSKKIKTVHHGHLFYGKDLSLNRNVLLYQLEASVSNEASVELIQSVNGFNHPNFFHILDIGYSKDGNFVVLELRKGDILSQEIESSDYPFQKCLEKTMRLGKMVDVALEEGIRSFSISTDNFWLTKDQTLMVINYWNEGESKFRGAQGLFHFLYQLLSKSTEVPDSVEKMRENLQTIKQTRSLSDREAQILDELFQEAYSTSSSFLSFILLLSRLMQSLDERPEEPVQVLETNSTPPEERWIDTVGNRINQIKQDGIPRAWMDPIKKVWSEKRKPILAVAILLVIAIPIFIFSSDNETANPAEETDQLTPIASEPVETTPQDKEHQTVVEDQLEVEPAEEEQAEDNQSAMDETSQTTTDGSTGITEVPQLIGLSQQEAEQQALASGLRYQYFLEVNEQQAGTVFRQDMEAGASTNKGSKITFWVSKGLEMQ